MNNQFDLNTLYGLNKTIGAKANLSEYDNILDKANNYPTDKLDNNIEVTNKKQEDTQLVPAEERVTKDDTGTANINIKKQNINPAINHNNDNIPITQQGGCSQCSMHRQDEYYKNKQYTTAGTSSPIRPNNYQDFALIESHAGLTETPVTLLQNRDITQNSINSINNTGKPSDNNTEEGGVFMNNTNMAGAEMGNIGMPGNGMNHMGMPNMGMPNMNNIGRSTNFPNNTMGNTSATGNVGMTGNINSGISGLDQNILTGADTAELGLFLRNLIESIQNNSTPSQYKVTAESLQYLNGFLRTQMGKLAEIEFLIGTNTTVIKRGYLTAIGANYLILQDVNSRQMTVCDFYNIKFVTFYL